MGQQNACCNSKYQKGEYQTPRGEKSSQKIAEEQMKNIKFNNTTNEEEEPSNSAWGAQDNPQGAEGGVEGYTQESQGAYLTFSDDNHGSMYLKWSRDPVEGALAFFQPDPYRVSPSSFKYNNGGQKEVLKSKVSTTGIGRQDYYKTWVQFIRECWKFKGVLKILEAEEAPELKVKLVMQVDENHKVICVNVGQAVSLEGIHAVVVAQSGTTIFEGMSTMPKNLFIETGHVYGAATALSTQTPPKSPPKSERVPPHRSITK